MEALRDTWLEEPDPEAQQRTGRRIQAQFFADLPYWPLGIYQVDSAYRRGLRVERRGLALPLNVRREA